MQNISNRPLVSIVIPTYKRHEQLNNLLVSIQASDYPKESIEVIIVDNAGDVPEEPSDEFNFRIELVRSPRNLWSNGARRLGTEYAHGQYFFHVDDDNVLEPACLSELVNALEEHPDLGMVGPIMLHDDSETILSIGARIGSFGLIHYIEGGKKLSEIHLPALMYGFDYLHNAILIRRNVLEKVSFDDETFPHNWAETDFGLRAGQEGYQMACVTSAIERHYDQGYTGPLTRIGPDKTYDQAKSRVLFRRRHMATLSEWLQFWVVVFPVSTIVYSWYIFRSSGQKYPTIAAYFMGTIDGLKQDIRETPAPKVATALKLIGE